MDTDSSVHLPKFRRIIDYGLTTLGIILFILFSAIAIQQVDDKKVAAGQNKQGTVVAASQPSLFYTPSNLVALRTMKEKQNYQPPKSADPIKMQTPMAEIGQPSEHAYPQRPAQLADKVQKLKAMRL